MKILVIQLRRIGDILLTTPVLSFLKQWQPDSTIDVLCEPMGRSVLETNPHIKTLHIYDRKHPIREIRNIRNEKYDVVFDFMNNPRSSLLCFLSGIPERVAFHTGGRAFAYNVRIPVPLEPEYVPLRKVRMIQEWLKTKREKAPEPSSIRPQLNLSRDDVNYADTWMRKHSLTPRSFIVIAPAHRHPVRQWRWEGFQETAIELNKRTGLKVFLAWGPGEEPLMAQIKNGHEKIIDVFPPTSMREMGALIHHAKLVVTNDSGVMHLSVAVGTPTVTIYGPTRPVDWNPALTKGDTKKQDIPLTASGVSCLGCHLNTCPVGHICMVHLSSERVVESCLTLLQKEKAS